MKRESFKNKKNSRPNKQRRSQRAHKAVLTALRDLLMEQPLTTISIEAIAERAGVGKQTIYRWYPDKASLYMDLYDTESPGSLNVPDMGSLEKELNQVSLQIWRFWKETASGQAFRQLLASCQSNAQSLAELRDSFMPPRRMITGDILKRAVARGEIAEENFDVLIDMVIGFNWYHLITDSLEDESVIPIMTSIILYGIMGPMNSKRRV